MGPLGNYATILLEGPINQWGGAKPSKAHVIEVAAKRNFLYYY